MHAGRVRKRHDWHLWLPSSVAANIKNGVPYTQVALPHAGPSVLAPGIAAPYTQQVPQMPFMAAVGAHQQLHAQQQMQMQQQMAVAAAYHQQQQHLQQQQEEEPEEGGRRTVFTRAQEGDAACVLQPASVSLGHS